MLLTFGPVREVRRTGFLHFLTQRIPYGMQAEGKKQKKPPTTQDLIDFNVTTALHNPNPIYVKAHIMSFKDLFDFKKERTVKEAVIFYVFYTGMFLLVTTVLGL